MSEASNIDDVEMVILGAILVDDAAYNEVCNTVEAKHFANPKNRVIYESIVTLSKEGQPIDIVTVSDKLKSTSDHIYGGLGYILELTNGVSIATHLPYHASILVSKYMQRELCHIGSNLMLMAAQSKNDPMHLIAETQIKLDNLLKSSASHIVPVQTIKKQIEQIVKDNMNGVQSKKDTFSIGINRFDNINGGASFGDLGIIAAHSSIGKTSLALYILSYLITQGKKVSMYSLEMTSQRLMFRILSIMSGIPLQQLRHSALDQNKYMIYHSAQQRIKDNAMFFDESTNTTVERICKSIAMLSSRYGVSVFVVDYIQICGTDEKQSNDELRIAYITRMLKNTALKYNVYIIALSQFSKPEEGKEPYPNMSKMRGSGQIEEAADHVMMIWRPEHYFGHNYKFRIEPNERIEGKAEINISKCRDGVTGAFLMGYDAPCTKFYNL